MKLEFITFTCTLVPVSTNQYIIYFFFCIKLSFCHFLSKAASFFSHIVAKQGNVLGLQAVKQMYNTLPLHCVGYNSCAITRAL